MEKKKRSVLQGLSLPAFFVLLFSFCCSPLSALDPDKPVGKYLLDQWTVEDGLPGNCIHAVARTPDGYLWFAVTKGLVRFDGIKPTTIPFIDKSTFPDTITTDRDGTLWIGSPAGLTKYRYDTRKFTTFTTKDGLTGGSFRRITEDMRGNLWLSFLAGDLNRFNKGKFTVFNETHGLEGTKINAIVEDVKGNLLFGTRENGIFKFQDERFLKYEIRKLTYHHLIVPIYEDKKGVLWIGTNKGLFRVREGANKKTDIFTTRDGLSDNYIIDIMEDRDGNLWVGTVNGLNRMKEIRPGEFLVESLLKECTITCLFEDKENSLWIGTFDSGIKRLKDNKFKSHPISEKYQREIIFSIYEDRRGDTWIGTLSGKLFKCRTGRSIEPVPVEGISGNGIMAIAEDHMGNLWLGTNGCGVFKRNGREFINFTTKNGLADNLVTSIFNDSQNNLWFSTFDGLSRYRDGVFQSYKTRDGLLGKRINNVYEDKNHHILAASPKGIHVIKNGIFSNSNVTSYLKDISVTCIYEDRLEKSGRIIYWIATRRGGLKRFEDGTFISYTVADGLAGNSIYQIIEDARANLWMTSDAGVLRVGKRELNQFAKGRISKINCTAFGITDGMKSIELNNESSRHSILKTRDGEIWVVTKKGITIVNPEKIKINKSPPPVVIGHMFFNGRHIPLPLETKNGGNGGDSFIGITTAVFDFTAPTFLSPETTRFKFKLEGFDPDWVYLQRGQRRLAYYRNLEPGSYTFTVTACNNDGVWNRTGASVSFTLTPCFQRTFLFKLIIFLGFLSLIGAFWLVKKYRSEKKIRYKRSLLNPQFTGECIKKLLYFMDIEKLYRDETISLQSLSEKLSITPHQLSQLLNDNLNKNFSDFINTYRVEEVKKILEDPKRSNQKLLAIAFDVGFKTKTAFNSAFKKHTNMTPSEYKKSAGCPGRP
ncbi:MAG: helix-turn-helix domain-containing protein [bacterium]|nr:helix-turn-helix domain-containing protein [bacterium]